MTLWTIQHEQFWTDLSQQGFARASFRRVDEHFTPAHRWMAAEFSKYLRSSTAVFPIWAWYRWSGVKRPKPDLRSSGHLPQGTRGVCLTLEVPEARVLLSQFELWHWVLNGWHLQSHATKLEGLGGSKRKSKVETETSWSNIFDLNFGDEDSFGLRDDRAIQACLDCLRLDDVREVKHFVAR